MFRNEEAPSRGEVGAERLERHRQRSAVRVYGLHVEKDDIAAMDGII